MYPIRSIRGCNYLPMARTSHNLSLSMLSPHGDIKTLQFPTANRDGFFDINHLRTELLQIKRAGFNSIRFWGDFTGWYCSPVDYINNMRKLCDELMELRIGMTYIVWNSIPEGSAATGTIIGAHTLLTGAADNQSNVLAGLWALSEAYQLTAANVIPSDQRFTSHWAAPMSAIEWDAQGAYTAWATPFKSSVNAYLDAIGDLFANGVPARVLDSFDLYNEPDSFYGNPTRRTNVEAFIKVTHDRIRARVSNPLTCTVGFAGVGKMNALLALGIPLTYYSVHNYARANTASILGSALAETPLTTVALTEFYHTQFDADGDLTVYMDALDAAGAPGYMWCYMQNNHYPTLDGIVQAAKPSKLIRFGEKYGHCLMRPRDDGRIRRWTGLV
jgi:hypothetical protein